MNCPRCSHEIDPNTGVCPNCGLNLNPISQAPVYTPNVDNGANKKKKHNLGFHAPSKGAKSFAAIFTAILFCPSLFCIVIDHVFFPNSHWAGYVVGALAVLWCFFVLPVLRITPTPVTVLVCFMSMTLYGLYIAKAIGTIGSYVTYAIPICIVICVLFTITCALINSGIARGLHIPALILAESAVFLMSVEAICEYQSTGVIELGWSLVWMAILVSLAVIFEAVAYASNGKK